MSPSKFEPAAEKITENITDNPEPQSLIDSPTKKNVHITFPNITKRILWAYSGNPVWLYKGCDSSVILTRG